MGSCSKVRYILLYSRSTLFWKTTLYEGPLLLLAILGNLSKLLSTSNENLLHLVFAPLSFIRWLYLQNHLHINSSINSPLGKFSIPPTENIWHSSCCLGVSWHPNSAAISSSILWWKWAKLLCLNLTFWIARLQLSWFTSDELVIIIIKWTETPSFKFKSSSWKHCSDSPQISFAPTATARPPDGPLLLSGPLFVCDAQVGWLFLICLG